MRSKTPASGRPRNRRDRADSDVDNAEPAPSKVRLSKSSVGAKMRVEDVAADVEILPEPGLPGRFLAEPVAQPIAARPGVLAVADEHALAVVRQHDERVRPALGFDAGQERLEQAECQRRESDRLEDGRGESAPIAAPALGRSSRAGRATATPITIAARRSSIGEIPRPGTATSLTTPQSFVVAADALGELGRHGVAIDRHQGIGRLATADLLGDPVAQLLDRARQPGPGAWSSRAPWNAG